MSLRKPTYLVPEVSIYILAWKVMNLSARYAARLFAGTLEFIHMFLGVRS